MNEATTHGVIDTFDEWYRLYSHKNSGALSIREHVTGDQKFMDGPTAVYDGKVLLAYS